MRTLFILLIFLFSSDLQAVKRGSSAPYISGDTFRAHCAFVYDELNQQLNPSQVKRGDCIFVETDYLDHFFREIHSNIENPYVLITHNSDLPIPGPHESYLNDPKLLGWFGQNVEYVPHPKLHPIPIGIANQFYPSGDTALLSKIKQKKYHRKNLLYMNFSIGTCESERKPLYFQFLEKPYCLFSSFKSQKKYFTDLAQSKFILSPRGKGIDCFRTWEALYMGTIPIVKSSSLDPLFKDLPVVIIQDWSQVDATFLNQKYRELKGKSFQTEKMYIDYWLRLIQEVAAQ